jgi:hypothetical protein
MTPPKDFSLSVFLLTCLVKRTFEPVTAIVIGDLAKVYKLKKEPIPPNIVLIGKLQVIKKSPNIHTARTICFGSSLQRPQEQFALCAVDLHYCGA